MGLAVLPSRLKDEIELLCGAILADKDVKAIPEIEKHAAWLANFADKYEFTADNVRGIIEGEIGKTFTRVLEDAGVYKRGDAGKAAFDRFVEYVNA